MNWIGTVDPSAAAANLLDALQRCRRPYVFTDDHATVSSPVRNRRPRSSVDLLGRSLAWPCRSARSTWGGGGRLTGCLRLR
jgi:hypothetical protein